MFYALGYGDYRRVLPLVYVALITNQSSSYKGEPYSPRLRSFLSIYAASQHISLEPGYSTPQIRFMVGAYYRAD
jgi:hypothetical protein